MNITDCILNYEGIEPKFMVDIVVKLDNGQFNGFVT